MWGPHNKMELWNHKHRHSLDVARGLHFQAIFLWNSKCVTTATYLINRNRWFFPDKNSPYEVLFNTKSKVVHISIWMSLFLIIYIIRTNLMLEQSWNNCYLSFAKKGYHIFKHQGRHIYSSRGRLVLWNTFLYKFASTEHSRSTMPLPITGCDILLPTYDCTQNALPLTLTTHSFVTSLDKIFH